MPINKRKLNIAMIISQIVEEMMKEDEAFYLETYTNGREIGLSLWTIKTMKKVCFSEYRNTDQIVVYSGQIHDFSMNGNTPSKKGYSSKRFFDYNNFVGAATYILEELRTPIQNATEENHCENYCENCSGNGWINKPPFKDSKTIVQATCPICKGSKIQPTMEIK